MTHQRDVCIRENAYTEVLASLLPNREVLVRVPVIRVIVNVTKELAIVTIRAHTSGPRCLPSGSRVLGKSEWCIW